MPTYANVHSTVGLCAEKTAKYFEEGKDILRYYVQVNGNYSIIFHGQGATGGVHKLIEITNLKKYQSFYENLETAYELKTKIEKIGNFSEICKSLLLKIKKQFEELFINISFCRISKTRDNKHKIICVICEKYIESEGAYNNHVNEEIHQQKKR